MTQEAAHLLENRVRLARRQRRWTVEELATRVGVGVATMRKVKRGDLTVAIATASRLPPLLVLSYLPRTPPDAALRWAESPIS